MFYFKTENLKVEATFAGRRLDSDWDNRESKTITFDNTLSLENALSVFHDGLAWSIVEEVPQTVQEINEKGEPTYHTVMTESEYDNSDFNMFGSIAKTFDGKVIVKMGKETELEQAYEILYGGND